MAKKAVAAGFAHDEGPGKGSGSMANALVKGLALTLGGGLAVGLGIKIGQTSPAGRRREDESIDFTPVLDRIEGVENRIVGVESQQEALRALTESGPMMIPSVHELEEQVTRQHSEVESLRALIQQAVTKSDERIDDLGYALNSLESKIPGLVDQSLQPKLDEFHDRVQRDMQETASKTLETFADRIQERVVEKITSLEGDLTRQSEAINHLRDYSLRTDQSLEKLLAGVESLADKINKKFEAPPSPAPSPSAAPIHARGPEFKAPEPRGPEPKAMAPTPSVLIEPVAPKPPVPAPAPAPAPMAAPKPMPLATPAPPKPSFPTRIELGDAPDARPMRDPLAAPKASPSGPQFEDLLAERPHSTGLRKAAFAGGGIALVATVVAGVELSGVLNKPTSAHSNSPNVSANKTAGSDALDTKKLSDQSELLDQARAFTQKREFSKAEDIYRLILKNDPTNTEVKRLLASALFRQEKIDESVKVLNSISEDKQGAPPQEQQ
jgi:hypothetical protein